MHRAQRRWHVPILDARGQGMMMAVPGASDEVPTPVKEILSLPRKSRQYRIARGSEKGMSINAIIIANTAQK
jgi:hypothetical protein